MKKLALFLITLHLGISSFSQCYFQKSYAVDQFDRFSCVNKNINDNFIVVGSWSELIYCAPDYEEPKDDFYIIEMDSCGLLVNETVFENEMDNSIAYIEETDANNYFLLGSLRTPCDFSYYFNYMHVNSLGEVINSGIFGENYNAYCQDATKLSNNNYVMVGSNLVLMVNAQGDTIASKRFNYSNITLKKVSDIPGTNSVIIIADLSDPYDFMIIRLDYELNIVWEKIYDRSIFDFIYGLDITQNHNILIAGSVVDTIIDDHAYAKYFIQRMNVDGDSLWCNYYGGMDSLGISSVMEIPETKDIIAIGSHRVSDEKDAYFMRADSLGNLLNDTLFGEEDLESFNNQWIIDSENIFLFGNKYHYYPTYGYLYIVKTNSNGYQGQYTNIPVISESNDIIVFPNPFQNKVTFNCSRESLIQSIYIYNIYGNIIYIKNGISNSNYTVLTNNFRSGIYFCSLRFSNGQTINRKIIKQ